MQATIAEAVRSELDLALGALSLDEAYSPTRNREAYAAYLRGVEAVRNQAFFGAGNLTEVSVAEFQLATELDPSFSRAWAALARGHTDIYYDRLDRTPARIKLAERALEMAGRLAPESPETILAAALFAFRTTRDYGTALERLASAARLRPGDGEINRIRSAVLLQAGRSREAVTESQKAMALDPLNVHALLSAAWAHAFLRDYDAAAGPIDQALRLAPNSFGAIYIKKTVVFHKLGLQAAEDFAVRALSGQDPIFRFCTRYEHLDALGHFEELVEGSRLLPELGCGNITETVPRQSFEGLGFLRQGLIEESRIAFQGARATLEAEIVKRPDDSRLFAALGVVYAYLGEREPALKAAREAVSLDPLARDAVDGLVPLWVLARVHAILGDLEEAMSGLEDFYAAPSWVSTRELLVSPDFAAVRGHPRMLELVKDLD